MSNIIVFITFLISLVVFGHEGENHINEDEGWETVTEKIPEETLRRINLDYLARVKPIFKNKCLDCHGTGNPMPWYAGIPGPKQLIQNDIKEAKEHMDMSNDFPFEGHGTPKDDLEALNKTVKENTMPPIQYKILHWSSSLTEDEKRTVNKWVADSLKLLTKSNEEEK